MTVPISAEHLVGLLLVGFVLLVIFVGVQIRRGKIKISDSTDVDL